MSAGFGRAKYALMLFCRCDRNPFLLRLTLRKRKQTPRKCAVLSALFSKYRDAETTNERVAGVTGKPAERRRFMFC